MNGRKKNIPADLKDFLDSRVALYNNISFIENDPISIPHLFGTEENIAISAFLTAIISWGQRKQIIKSARQLMALMDDDPYGFLQNSTKLDLSRFKHFYYRTFNNADCILFVERLKVIYTSGGSLQKLFENQFLISSNIKTTITGFREIFFAGIDPKHAGKHLSNPTKGSSAKRINMFMRIN